MTSLNSKLQKLLLDAGLSETQVFVYMELKKKPATTIWELVQRTGLGKSSVYDAFFGLKKLQMVRKTHDGIEALSLKALVAELLRQERHVGKTAHKLKQLAPFLHAPNESVEEFQTLYTKDQIAEAYMFMAEHKYDTNLDFGDFDNFIEAVGSLDLAFKFREKRAAHAKHHAILTNCGKNLKPFLNKELMKHFKNRFDIMQEIDFKNRWIIFSDTGDYVMYNDVSDPEFPVSTLIKSRPIADAERLRFQVFSKKYWKD